MSELEQFFRENYNTFVVVSGTMLLGMASGIIGSFLFLRKRALLGDAASHATLPGIAIAFMLLVHFGHSGKSLPILLLGGLLSGLVAIGFILFIRYQTRLKEDAALGIVLSVFFGVGLALAGIIQDMKQGHAAGLRDFIYGKTASMIASDALLIAATALLIAVACTLLFKELTLVCFDQDFAGAQGWPVVGLDLVIMGLAVVAIIIGLQAVGLILMIALLIIPPAAARFWTDRLPAMIGIAAGIGAFSGLVGALLSASLRNLPAGAIIVLVASTVFVFSMLFGRARGVTYRALDQRRLQRRIAREHLLRAVYEWQEQHDEEPGLPHEVLLNVRSWNEHALRRVIAEGERSELVYIGSDDRVHLTRAGLLEAHRLVRNHRLWEIFMVTHADIAPSHVDRTADRLEHVLGQSMVDELEQLLAETHPELIPPSPHLVEQPGAGVH